MYLFIFLFILGGAVVVLFLWLDKSIYLLITIHIEDLCILNIFYYSDGLKRLNYFVFQIFFVIADQL